jgi:hypothetical protein
VLVTGYAAMTHDPKEATGMDTALKTLAGQPYGTVLLLTVAAGLACLGCTACSTRATGAADRGQRSGTPHLATRSSTRAEPGGGLLCYRPS